MNVYDSHSIAASLNSLGYKATSSINSADLIFVNTCTIRAKAEHKAFSFLGKLYGLKKKKNHLIIGVGGCVAQQEGKKIIKRMPHVDFVIGTHSIGHLPNIIKQMHIKKEHIVNIETDAIIPVIKPVADGRLREKITSFVTIMSGCDNFCSYCVVPYVRGRESSKNPDNILQEIECLVKSGVKEVTLLGQNVNSYGNKEGLCSFSELLKMINKIEGLKRIRFTTSHPKDLSDDLADCFKNLEKLCNSLHLPVQSGSNKILKKMNRKYTIDQYFNKLEKLRKNCAGISITTDIIVGFPEESDDDFNMTMKLVEKVQFDQLFAFKYSDRPNTPSARLGNKVSETEKKNRLQKILTMQKGITLLKNQALIGSCELILVEGLSKQQDKAQLSGVNGKKQWTGRTTTNKVVNFFMDNDPVCCKKTARDDTTKCQTALGKVIPGTMVFVEIENVLPNCLTGKPIWIEPN